MQLALEIVSPFELVAKEFTHLALGYLNFNCFRENRFVTRDIVSVGIHPRST